ncbi:MAG: TRAP transporter large permease subunit [Desulfobacter sp.]|nr:MAG: TRAP transporter large permease subunit [Desulfobacter sp.]
MLNIPFLSAKWALLVPIIVLGGIYGGISTPTEAAAVAVVYAFVIEGFVIKSLDWVTVYEILKNSAVISSSVFLVVIMATALGQVFVLLGLPDMMVQMLLGISDKTYVLLPIIILFLLVMGTFMDALANILIFAPLLLPVVTKIGVDPVHFGIIMIINISMGFCTPPVGVNLFIGSGLSSVPIEKLSKAVLPFLLSMIVSLLIITFFPGLSLWLLK